MTHTIVEKLSFNLITEKLTKNGHSDLANSLNDVKRIKQFAWDTYRYAALGNEDGRWFTIVIERDSLNTFNVRPAALTKTYHKDDEAAEKYFNRMK